MHTQIYTQCTYTITMYRQVCTKQDVGLCDYAFYYAMLQFFSNLGLRDYAFYYAMLQFFSNLGLRDYAFYYAMLQFFSNLPISDFPTMLRGFLPILNSWDFVKISFLVFLIASSSYRTIIQWKLKNKKITLKISYYAGIMLDASAYLLCSKLCRHNPHRPKMYTLYSGGKNSPLQTHQYSPNFFSLACPHTTT